MRMMRAFAAMAVLGLAIFLLAGCGKDNSADGAPTADEAFAEGVTYLEDEMADVDFDVPPWDWGVDLAEANGYFEDALDADPDHCGALLLAALTRLGMVLQDPDLADIVETLLPEDGGGAGPPAERLSRMFSKREFFAAVQRLRTSSRDDIPFSELQDFIEDVVLPALDEAEAYLESFEDQDCFVILEIEVEEKREVFEVEIDATDVYLAHAPLDLLQTLFYMVVSYNVDVAPGQTFQELIDDDPDFLSLRPGNHMPSAYNELVEMAGHLDDCAWSVAHETDPQDNDIFTNSDDIGYLPMGAGFADTLAMIAAEIEDGLQNGVSFNLAEDLGEPEAPDFDILLDIEEMFNDPLDPWTAYFPEHTWLDSMTMDVTRPIDFPDPTFSESMPGMTNPRWGEILDWLDP